MSASVSSSGGRQPGKSPHPGRVVVDGDRGGATEWRQPHCHGTSSGRREADEADGGSGCGREETRAAEDLSSCWPPMACTPGCARPGYTIELEGRAGSLRIHCKGVTPTQLGELSRELWR
jgi:hypothetical protein